MPLHETLYIPLSAGAPGDWPEAPAVASANTAPATQWSQDIRTHASGPASPQDREDYQPGLVGTTQANLTSTK